MGRNVLPPARAGSWFNPELRTKDYDSPGDAYEDSKYNDLVAAKWNVRPDSEDKYLILVKRASQSKWIHLRLLADFMQIGRIPRDWVNSVIPDDRENRWGRANICILDYSKDNKPEGRYITNIKGRGLTTEELKKKLHIDAIKKPSFRLYVVEDLSRNVIEALGTKFGIDPDFFRAHIADYAWYNVRDRWRELQPLEVVRSQRNWFQIRYVTTRYCATKEKETGATKGGCFETALEEAKNFNILRRPDDDKSRGWWDSRDAVVALTRSRATFWHKPRDSENETSIGTVILSSCFAFGTLTGFVARHPTLRPDCLPRAAIVAWPPQLPPCSSNIRGPRA